MDNYRLTEADFEDYTRLFFYSFNTKSSSLGLADLRIMYQHAKVYGERVNGDLQTSIMCLPFTTNFFGKVFKVTSYANVMSAPEYGKSDGIARLNEQIMTDMHHDGIVLSYLDPFSDSYYRRFGFETVFELLQLKGKLADLKRFPKTENNQIKRFKFVDVVEQVYEIFNQHNNSGGIRESKWWWQILKHRYGNYNVAFNYDQTGQITGYLIYSSVTSTLIVEDLLFETPAAFNNLMNFLKKHRSQFEILEINSSDPTLKPTQFFQEVVGLKQVIEPFMMIRIVDLVQFIQNYPHRLVDLKPICIKVTDFLTWNDKVWKLLIEAGKITFVESNSKPDFTLSIQTFAKALFGYQSLLKSYQVGEIDGEIEQVKAMDKMMINQPVQLNANF